MLDVIRWLKQLKNAITQMSNLIYSHAGRHKPGGADPLFPADYNIEPATDNTYSLGSDTKRWKNISLAGDLKIYGLNQIIGIIYFEEAEYKNIGPAGTVVSDDTASNGLSVKGTAGGSSGTIVFGPYKKDIPPGNYVVLYRLKVSDNTSTSGIAYIDVYIGGTDAPGILAGMTITPSDFESANTWQVFALPVTLNKNDLENYNGVEFRVMGFNPNVGADLYVDWIAVVPANIFWTLVGKRVGENIIPARDSTYDLGSLSYRWKRIYGVNIYGVNIYSDSVYTDEAKRITQTVISRYDLDFDLPVIPDDLLGFNPPYKVEAWDDSTGTWVDVTSRYNWGVLHDQDNTSGIDLRNVGWQDTNTGYYYARVRLYYDTGGRWQVPAYYLAINTQHLDYITYLKVEHADDADFTTNVETRLDWSGAVSASDRIVLAKLTSTVWRRYVRIEIHAEERGGSDMVLRSIHLLGLSFWGGGSKLMKHWVPLEWTTDKQIKFLNHALPNADNTYDLGSSTKRWRNIYGVNIYGNTIYEGGSALSSKYALTDLSNVSDSTILNKLKNVDGSGSGLDADLLDGKDSSYFAPASHTHALGDLSDVSLSSPSSGQVLKYNGTDWVNGNVDWDEITNKPSTFPPSAHASSHKPGGSDALFPADFSINPSADNTYDLGSSTKRWRNLYLAGTLYGGGLGKIVRKVVSGTATSSFTNTYTPRTGGAFALLYVEVKVETATDSRDYIGIMDAVGDGKRIVKVEAKMTYDSVDKAFTLTIYAYDQSGTSHALVSVGSGPGYTSVTYNYKIYGYEV